MKKFIFVVPLIVGTTFMAVGAQSLEETARPEKLLVESVVEESSAETAGIKAGDVFIEYDGTPVQTLQQIFELKMKVETDSVEVVVLRDGKRLAFQLPAGQMGVYLKEMLPEVEYKEDAVIIEGIPKLSWSTDKFNSFLAAVEAIGNHLGIEKDYLYLNGVSGAAFRLHFHKGWCPSSPDPTCGFASGEKAFHALGLEYHSRFVAEDDTVGQKALREEIMASIDRGMPVIAIDLIGVPEWGIIAGYQAGGAELLCRTYFDRREGYDIAEKFPWAAYFIDNKGEMPDDVGNYLKSFRIALENLTTPEYEEYVSGLAAFDKWLERLQTDDFAAMDSAGYAAASHANAWIYDRLADDRDLAVEYLERIAGAFPELTEKLKMLSKLYREESKLLKPTEDVVMYEFNMTSRDDWSEEMRAEAVARLQKAKTKEEAALKIWKQIVPAEKTKK